ncbi:S8 family peptidase [Mucilaginibacter sp. HMF5004]|uniref:S8 family serine peptidase n=1 Tax=Mucilaginibacter rivuli TaxID=2857527 RepID=UPI001C5DD616|nr:S8 family serine peptidase [Mucilaginibacter rivuli]MBW4888625.1 S8 family peptidase [Mucilaginibacter rivuli]
MKRFYPTVFITLLLGFFTIGTQAQQVPATGTIQSKQLTAIAAKADTEYNANRQQLIALAKKNGWTISSYANGGAVVLQGVDKLGFPIYAKTVNNIIAAASTRTNTVQPGGLLGLNLTGSSSALVNKLAIWDGSGVYAAHQEFAGKNIQFKDATPLIYIDHAAHVAGTMIAAGTYAPAKGMAFGATSLLSYDFSNDINEMATAAAAGLILSNHSYDHGGGWYYDTDQTRWEWDGLPGDTVDYRFGFYDTYAQSYDQISYNAPKYLMVFAAGNHRGETGPNVGTTYYGYNTRTDKTIVNKGPRPATISSNGGYDVISASNTAKNILSVGAVNPLPFGPSTGSDISIAYFSSFGPTDDGRIKPDICGDGVNVLSSGSTAPDAYLYESGTSMASPNVSGSLYLLQEYYAQKNAGNFMRSATLKALVCNTALDAGRPGPDYIYGWGLLDVAKAAQAITDNNTKSLITEKTLGQGQTQTFTVTASGNGPLVAGIVWTDPAGTPSALGTINDRTPKLVNDLDIRVSDGSTTFRPWVLDPTAPGANATTGDNIRDNVEQVYIAGAVPGKSYTITVTHKGILTNASQDFSLVVTGIGGVAYCASAPSSNADSKVNNLTLSDLNFTAPGGCTTYSNYTTLTATLEQGKTYPLSLTLGTCGANFSKIAKVYIDWNGNGVFDANELVATSGVIAATGTYSTNITVPPTVIPDNYSLMRVVLVETTDPNTITACGTYAKGETQDYRVKFIKTTLDAGTIAINSPVTGSCPATNESVSVRLKNFGSTAISNVPITVTITSVATGNITTLNESYPGTLAPLAEDDLILTGTFNAIAGGSYTITAATQLANDAVTTNNQVTATSVISNTPFPTNLSAFYCTDAKTYSLNATGSGQVFWYQNIGDVAPFTFGNSVVTAQAPINNTYYASLNDFSGNVGPATKNTFAAGAYNQFTPRVKVYTKVPLLIESARLYIGNSGKITFTVTTPNGQPVSSTTINVTATRANPAAGALTDDPTDQGKIYNLNLALPAAGFYTISVSYPDGATLYRNNGGVTGYPFSLNGLFNIVNNNATSTATPTDTTYYRNFYYYFYNMHVKSLGCPSPSRVAVTLVKPVITLNGTVLTSNFTTNNQWYLNGNLIAGASSQTYTPLRSGVYRVDIIAPNGCVSKSDDFNFVLPVTGTGLGSDISLAVFPVPAANQLNIAFNAAKNGVLSISVLNSIGQHIYDDTKTLSTGPFNTIINTSAFADGPYFIKLKIDDKVYSKQFTILK